MHNAKCCLTRVDSSHRLQKNAHRDSVEDGLGSLPSKNGRLGFIAQVKTAASFEQLKLPDFAEVEIDARSWWSYSAFSGGIFRAKNNPDTSICERVFILWARKWGSRRAV